jgi:hypothetical protein
MVFDSLPSPSLARRLVDQAWEVLSPFRTGNSGIGDHTYPCSDTVDIDTPEPGRAIVTAGGDSVPVRAEGHRVDPIGVAGQRGRQAGMTRIGDVPQPHRIVGPGSGQGTPIGTPPRRECLRFGRQPMPGQFLDRSNWRAHRQDLLFQQHRGPRRHVLRPSVHGQGSVVPPYRRATPSASPRRCRWTWPGPLSARRHDKITVDHDDLVSSALLGRFRGRVAAGVR